MELNLYVRVPDTLEGGEERDAEEGLMGAFREIGYGVLFYVFTIVGAIAGINVLAREVSDDFDGRVVYVTNAVVGAALGGGFWLYIRYGVLNQPQK
jgi:hypothetical protein